MTKPRIHIHISHEAAALLERAAAQDGVTKTAIIDAAIKQLLAPEDESRELRALVRRLDRLNRVTERLADDTAAQTETLALYILYYLCITPPLPDDTRAGAEALGRKRFEHFVGQVGDRLMGKERYTDALLNHMRFEPGETALEATS